MALSNWLTRNEWSASFIAYLTGVDPSGEDPEAFPYPVDLSTHLRTGICIVNRCGYKEWAGIRVPDDGDPDSIHKDEDSKYGASACTAEGDNSECLVEVMTGRLDVKTRSKEVLAWMDVHPELDFPSLRAMCEIFADEVQVGSGSA